MSEQNDKNGLSRRDFFKTAGAVGIGALLGSVGRLDAQQTQPAAATKLDVVPRRPFGKTGVNVSILALGGMFDINNNQSMMKQALKWGVDYWDTASMYGGGKSEQGIGKYFARFPEDRKRIFLVSKSRSRDPEGLSRELNQSLERLKTNYIDLYFVHMVRNSGEIQKWAKQWEAWSAKAKADKKIKFFGFSTHSNMADCLLTASKLPWIDGIMTTYNYRVMSGEKMKSAVDACTKAGIGLTAMKTQARRARSKTDPHTQELLDRLIKKGFTAGQANIKAVWENPIIASICSQMPNMNILMSNTAAAMDKTELSAGDLRLMDQYARQTASDYCSGCSEICEGAVDGDVPVSDILRYMMYYNSYGDRDLARQLFAEIPSDIRSRLSELDYSAAEQRCPQRIAIGEVMKQASQILA